MGDYGNARIIVQNTSSGVITGIQDANGNYASDEELMTLNATEGLTIQLVIAWSTRILFVDVVLAQDDILPGFNPR